MTLSVLCQADILALLVWSVLFAFVLVDYTGIEVDFIDLFENKLFSPKQVELFEWYRSNRIKKAKGLPYESTVVMPWGRRCGKSDGASGLFCEMLCDLLEEIANEVADGKRAPWVGIGQERKKAVRQRPHTLAFVIAPSTRDLRDIQGHILATFSGDAAVFLAPDDYALTDQGGRLWFVHEGACVAVDFIPAKQSSAMVGRGVSLCLISESGFVETHHWDKLSPAFWDTGCWTILEGTPRKGDLLHWYTQQIVSGLPDGHAKADRKVAPRNENVCTIRANTIDHGFLPRAREAAAREAQYRGKSWSDTWIDADWETKEDVVFGAFEKQASVVRFEEYPRAYIERHGKTYALPDPDLREAYIDWHDGSAPGAATALYIWRKHPLDEADPRCLMLVVDEEQDDEARMDYVIGTEERPGWWSRLHQMKTAWGLRRMFGDPTSPKLLADAYKQRVSPRMRVEPADNEDKAGRIELLNSQCNVGPNGWPALLISERCVKTIKALSTVQWKKVGGMPSDKPSRYNLHIPDTLCYAAGRHVRPLANIPRTLS